MPVASSPMAVLDEEEERIDLSGEYDPGESLGILLFRRWSEEDQGFSEPFMDYMVSLDEQGYVDFGMVLKGNVDDMDDLIRLRKVSNFTQAVNNSLSDIAVVPPFFYLAVPVKARKFAQDILDVLVSTFGVEGSFFTFPRI